MLNENLTKAKNKTTGLAGWLRLEQVILGLPSPYTEGTRQTNREKYKNNCESMKGEERRQANSTPARRTLRPQTNTYQRHLAITKSPLC